ncbi:PIN domain-containing protein [Anabaena cylindrica FACHB-243]|uniref:PilT protein domain protein n=1 Tax=Anabaena cylindrica (strain ATCC 27899 / PCC 7122) TaxID=272123 RepID=K9ZDG1_ANACC|nr:MULTISPECIES: PIN domain-containing protein [Anabaena]AFZ57243.1 PilT protein domain protein [Anabaena cylindrica PCC 7122]MBD2420912.1 PIN domain-containing protein [Anabaena cylindrica FACHB-243]MBY5285466.1 type II toxin-antitoxin system VapC family toxin [Anabaena sp. CCAP 1446/1C]MBY5308683.1 type II toxin-antitoxin system VapC family toxin [Anabaena sp. CCAP 1446/1C]MCM2405665.1 PIN domain-containing protein [Anabaena sp. CCAP 1446/1C]
MKAIVLDTHAIIWYFLKSPKLSNAALTAIDQADSIYIPSISIIEIIYLQEKGKIPETALQKLIEILANSNTGWSVIALNLEVAQTITQIPRNIVPEMVDRIITATAFYLNLPLVTCDSKINLFNIQIIW